MEAQVRAAAEKVAGSGQNPSILNVEATGPADRSDMGNGQKRTMPRPAQLEERGCRLLSWGRLRLGQAWGVEGDREFSSGYFEVTSVRRLGGDTEQTAVSMCLECRKRV